MGWNQDQARWSGEMPNLDVPDQALEEIAERLVEKCVREGLTNSQISAIFCNPLSGGAYAVCLARGCDPWLPRLIARVRAKLSDTGCGTGWETSRNA